MKALVSVYNKTSDIYGDNDYCPYQEFVFDEDKESEMWTFISEMVIDHNKALVVSQV